MKTRFLLTFVFSSLLALTCYAEDIPKIRAAALTENGGLCLISPNGEEQILSDYVEVTESEMLGGPVMLSGNAVFYIDPSDAWRAIDINGRRISLFDNNDYHVCYDEETEMPYVPVSAGSRFFIPDDSEGYVVWGAVDNTGKNVIPFVYKLCHASEGIIALGWKEGSEKDETLFIDMKTQKTLCKPDVTLLSESFFSEGLIWVSNEEGECGFIDKHGKIAVPLKYSYEPGRRFINGRAIVCNDEGETVSVDKQGNETILDDDIEEEREKSYPAFIWEEDGTHSLINEKGDKLFSCEYTEGIFHNGYCAVMRDGKWGFVDKSGKLAVPCRYSNVTNFVIIY